MDLDIGDEFDNDDYSDSDSGSDRENLAYAFEGWKDPEITRSITLEIREEIQARDTAPLSLVQSKVPTKDLIISAKPDDQDDTMYCEPRDDEIGPTIYVRQLAQDLYDSVVTNDTEDAGLRLLLETMPACYETLR